MPKKYRVKLSKVQREKLQELTSNGTIKIRKYKRARVLLLAAYYRVMTFLLH